MCFKAKFKGTEERGFKPLYLAPKKEGTKRKEHVEYYN
jgi:hypothetical protein